MKTVPLGWLFLSLALTGCGAALNAQQRYSGTLAGCGETMSATLTRVGDGFAFAAADQSLLLRGKIMPDGRFSGSLDTQPAGKPPYVLSVTGRFGAAAAELRYSTPRCTATGRLDLVPVRLLP
ncbi:MAG: hypothetical protein M0Z28_31115 [Rhodospirillales bacterium]|nr:hypothetical protein [Rhodospirillales bacterium]